MTVVESRRAFAEELRFVAHVTDERVIEAFATPDADSRHLCHNDARGRRELKSLHRQPHDAGESCWLHGNGWCLSAHQLH